MSEQQKNQDPSATHRFSSRPSSKVTQIALAISCLYTTPAVVAQTAGGLELEEVLVTASKKGATSLMDTAVSATVVTGEALEVRQVRNVEDLQFQTPGMVVDASAGTPRVAIRGIGQDGTLMHAENGVTVYADDIILQRTQAVTAAFFDLERVDVLKGPQGTAFGRNANGGSVNYISRRPVEGLTAEAGVTGGSYDRQEIYGIFNYGTGDYGVRVGAEYKEDDGFAENLTLDEDLNGRETTVVKGSFSFVPTDSFDGIFRLNYFDEDLNGPAVMVNGAEPFSAPQALGEALGIPVNVSFDPDEDYEVYSELGNRQQSEVTTGSLHLNWDIGDLQLRSITGYQDGEYIIQNDADHSDLDLIPVPHNDFDNEQFSQEFVLSGSAGSVDWLVGAYYLTEEVEQYVTIEFALNYNPAGVTLILDDDQDLTSQAAFAQGIWNISDMTRLVAGVRYTEDEKDIDYNQSAVLGPLSPAPGFEETTCQESFDETWDDTTWDLALERDLSDDHFAYAKINSGFKAGGFKQTACGEFYDPEQLTAFEIGYKGTFRDGALTLATSAFYYDYEDIQLVQVAEIEGSVATSAEVTNAAEAEVYGIDAELRALLTDSISVDLGLSWMPTAEYEDYENVDSLDIRTIDPMIPAPDPLDLSGNRLNRAPEYSGLVGLNYAADLGPKWTMDARLELYFTDEIAYSPFERPNTFNDAVFPGLEKDSNIQDGYELVNAYVSFNYGDSWTVNLFGKNLTDEYYLTGIIENSGPQHIHGDFGRPREYGAQLIYRFAN